MCRRQLDKPQIDAILEELEFGAKARAEELEPYQLVQLGNRLHAAIQASGGRQPSEHRHDEEE